MLKKMIDGLRTHKPLDWRYIVILSLLFQLSKREIALSLIILTGFVSYPKEVDYKTIFENAGDKIANIYTTAMTKLYEGGFNLAKDFYPHNVWVGKLASYCVKALAIIFIANILIWIANSFMYNKKSKEDVRDASTTKS